MKYYKVVSYIGVVHTRSAKNAHYNHAVVKDASVSFHSSLALALAAQNADKVEESEVIATTQISKSEYDAINKEKTSKYSVTFRGTKHTKITRKDQVMLMVLGLTREGSSNRVCWIRDEQELADHRKYIGDNYVTLAITKVH